jgi:uncharacterized protein
MTRDELEYIRRRLSTSEEAIAEAEAFLEGGHTAAAVNRLCYACFYAVTTLLFSQNMSASKHEGMLSLFDKNWIDNNRLPRSADLFYRDLFSHQQLKAGQAAPKFSPARVAAWTEKSKEFVAQVAGWLMENVPGLSDTPPPTE